MHNRINLIGLSVSLILVLVCSVLLVGKFSSTNDRSVPNASAPPIKFNRAARGYYAGTSDINVGRVGWFLRLDSESGNGELYLPPRIIQLRDIKLKPDGPLDFNLIENGKSFAKFEGQLDGSIQGKFTYLDGNFITTTLEEVQAIPIQHQVAAYVGFYSNVRYVEEAGDLVGMELLLIPHKNSLVGSLTQYEGVPGGIHALSDVKLLGDSIEFSVITHHGIEGFSGKLSSGGLIVKKVGSDQASASLPKISGWMDSLRLKSTTVAPRQSKKTQ